MFDESAKNQPDEVSLESVPVPYAETASGTCGDNLTWTLIDGVLTIQGTGAMDDYYVDTDLGKPSPWYDYRKQIRTIIIGEGMTEIGYHAFYECSSLTSVTIPKGVTSIESNAFSYCTSLTSITIPEGVRYLGSYMFIGCTSLTDVNIPESLTEIHAATFQHCTSLASVNIPESVTSIGRWVFSGCSGLTSVNIPDSVTSIEDGVFEDCTSLTRVTIPEGVTSIGEDAFWGSGLTSVTIPKSVASIGDLAFSDCTSLTDVYYSGSKEDWDNISIGNGNEQLLNATIHYNQTGPSTDATPDATTSGTCGLYGDNVTWSYSDGTLTIEGTGSMASYDGSVGFFRKLPPWEDYNSEIHTINIDDGVISIGSYAFYSCIGLTRVSIPDSVIQIGSYAFDDCQRLTVIDIPDSVASIGDYAFQSSGLTSATIPDSVIHIGKGAFKWCHNLISVIIPDSITAIDDDTFIGCSSLAGVTIPDSITTIGKYAFYECISLTNITIPDNVTTIGNCAFYYCPSLTSVTIPNSVATIGNSAFSYCGSLTDVYYSGSEEDWKAISIGSDNECLTSATIHYNSTGPEGPDPGETETGKLGWDEEETQWTIAVGNTLTLTVQMDDGSAFDANKLNWSSSSYGVIKIDDSGQKDENTAYVVLLGIAPGKTTLTASMSSLTSSGMIDVNSPRVSQEIYVVDNRDIRFQTSAPQYVVGGGKTLDICAVVAGLSGSDAENVKWSIEDEGNASVQKGISTVNSETGLACVYATLTGIVMGETQVTLTTPDGRTASYPVRVSNSTKEQDNVINPKASGEFTLAGTTGTGTWRLGNSGTLFIEGSGAIPDYTSAGEAPWGQYWDEIKIIRLGTGITGIGSNAFRNYTSLHEITIPASLEFVSANAFQGDNGLSKAYFGGSYPTDWNTLKSKTASGNDPLKDLERSQIVAYSDRNKVVINSAYNTDTYATTREDKALVAFINLAKSINDYIENEKIVSENNLPETEAVDDTRRIEAMKECTELKLALERYIRTYMGENVRNPSPRAQNIMDAIYLNFANTIDTTVKKEFKLGKIDLKKGKFGNIDFRNTLISTQIIRSVGQYIEDVLTDDVVFEDVEVVTGSIVDTITVTYSVTKGYYIKITTNDSAWMINHGLEAELDFKIADEATANAMMEQYLGELCGAVVDLSKEALKSYFKYLDDILDFSSAIQEQGEQDVRDAIESFLNIFQLKNGTNMGVNAFKVGAMANEIKTVIKKGNKITFNDLVNAGKNLQEIGNLDAAGIADSKAPGIVKAINSALADYMEYVVLNPGTNVTESEEAWAKELVKKLKESVTRSSDTDWSYTKLGISGPIDFEIYDGDNCIGSVKDGSATYGNDILILVEGSSKEVYIPGDMDIDILFTGTDSGIMTYVMEEVSNGVTVGRKNYYNIPLTEGCTYTQTFHTGTNVENLRADAIVADNGDSIFANEYLDAWDETLNSSIYIDCVAENGGTVNGAGNFPKGDVATLYATPDNGQEFTGWYLDNVLISAANPYQFSALESAEIHARFRTPYEEIDCFNVSMGNEYRYNTVVSVYQDSNALSHIELYQMNNQDRAEFTTVKAKMYNASQVLYSESTLTADYDLKNGYWLHGIDLKDCTELELCDESGNLIAVLYYDDETPPDPASRYTIILNASPAEGGSVTGNGTYDDGESVTVKATPASDYRFVCWMENGKQVITSATYTFNVTANRTLTAVFEQIISSGGSSTPDYSSSSDSDPTYSITVPSRVTGGTVKLSPTNASAGQRVTITVKPNSGYELDTLTVTNSKGNILTLTDQGDGKYTFTMPSSKVSIDVRFKATASATSVTTSNFTDVPANTYYADAVAWAVANGITYGVTETAFGPDVTCTRAQIVSFLWRQAGSPNMSSANPFTDVSATNYYYDAVLWAVENGITFGSTDSTFSPNAICTRAQAMTFLYRDKKSPAVSGTNNFTDVSADDYYADAIQWAVTNGVTYGTTSTTFSPDQDCTRAQIISFLYRARAN